MDAPHFKDHRLLQEIALHTRTKKLHKDEVLISPGERIPFVPIILKGTLRILREDEQGRELFL